MYIDYHFSLESLFMTVYKNPEVCIVLQTAQH